MEPSSSRLVGEGKALIRYTGMTLILYTGMTYASMEKKQDKAKERLIERLRERFVGYSEDNPRLLPEKIEGVVTEVKDRVDTGPYDAAGQWREHQTD